MKETVELIVLLAGQPPALFGAYWGWRWIFTRDEEAMHRVDGAGAISGSLLAVFFALAGLTPLAALMALFAIWCAWDWWRKRKRRKRTSPKALGAKSRALVAALVRRAREAARPRPVLRPLPGGAS